MRTIRHLLVRTLGPLLLLPQLSCGYPKPSPKSVAEALAQPKSGFAEPLTVAVARRVDARTDPSMGGGPLDDRQLAKVDGVLGILRMNKLVDIEDVYGPSDDGGYNHIITVRPAADAPADLFVPSEEGGLDPTWSKVRRTIGWRVALARRKLIGVTQVLDHNNPNGERLSPGYVLAYVNFRWESNEIGELFDQGMPSFDELPDEVRNGARDAGNLDTSRNYSGKVFMTRGSDGDWRVTLFQCTRCTTQ